MKKLVVPLLLAAAVCGCASTYRQPGAEALLHSEVAVIELEDCLKLQCPIIVRIDGKVRPNGWITRYELLPGLRTVEFKMSTFNLASKSNVSVAFEARAGQVYEGRMVIDQKAMLWSPIIVERSSGVIVSRAVEPDSPQDEDAPKGRASD
jgi:hypothetical protein